jgi:hypothetical protein
MYVHGSARTRTARERGPRGPHAARPISLRAVIASRDCHHGSPTAGAIPMPQMRFVAGALVSSGEVATIALEECNRRAAGLDRQNRAARLARIEQAAAPRSAEEQGSRSEHPRRWAPVAGPVALLANLRSLRPPSIGLAFAFARVCGDAAVVVVSVAQEMRCRRLGRT